MMRRASFPLLFAVAGSLLFALALWRASLWTPPRTENRAIARVRPVFGDVSTERDGRNTPASERPTLQRLDSVETGAGAEALLDFPDGSQVRLLENSVALLDLEAGHPVIVLKDGDVWVETAKEGNESVLISREGARRTLAQDRQDQRQSSQRQLHAAATRANRDPAKEASKPARVSSADDLPFKRKKLEALTADYIQATLRTQRNSFFKCYAQLLQKTPGVSGEAALSFTIERTGKVSQTEVASSNLQDPKFRRCLTDAIRRVEFKSFAGEPVNTLFPLRFQ